MERFGRCIQDYDVYEVVGQGGFAKVFRAMCRKTGLEVAIKKIDRKRMIAEAMDKRIKEEITIHSILKHPSILQLYTWFEDQDYVYLVLELCHDGELQSYLQGKRGRVLSESEACVIMRQVIEGLLYLHDNWIIHRDLKLANILLTKNMHVKIGDFGLAIKLGSPFQKQMTMCGTPNYISPEVATRGPHALEADIWALGIILYTCLVGMPPFDSDDGLKSTLTKVVVGDPKFPPHLSHEAQDLMRKLLQKNPKDRIELKRILDHPFFHKKHGNGSMVVPPPMRCMSSCDSGVGTASYLTSQSQSQSHNPQHHNQQCNSCSQQRMMAAIMMEQQQQPINQKNMLMPNRVMPPQYSGGEAVTYGSSVPSCQTSLPASSPLISLPPEQNHSSNCCSHAWRQCSQCSHNDACGCMKTTGYSTVSQHSSSLRPKIMNNQDNQHSHQTSKVRMSSTAETGSSPPKTRISVNPITTLRLKPFRQKTKNVICSILDTGDVCLEFLRVVQGQERVWEVMRISSDGMRIILYQPRSGRGVEISEHSPAPFPAGGADAIYNYENLPEKHWKKYSYAFKFVELVKSRIPKVTYYSEQAKCYLMENGLDADFQATFYQGGKICKSQSKISVSLVTPTKSFSFDVSDNSSSTAFPPDSRFMWEHFLTCLNHCETLCLTLEQMQGKTKESVFPVVIGRRPQPQRGTGNGSSPLSELNSNKENITPPSVLMNIPTMRGYDASIASTRVGGSIARFNPQPLKKVYIPSIGSVVQFTNGEIHINYYDSTKLVVNSTSAEVIFTDATGRTRKYTGDTDMTDMLRGRLTQMPLILKELMDSG